MSAELIVETFVRFRSWTTLYFCSLISTACGILVYAVINIVTNILEPFGSDAMNASTFIAKTCVTTGFALVVYSRLHTIAQLGYRNHLRYLLIALLVISIALRVPEIVLMVVIKHAYHASGFLITLSNRVWYVDCGHISFEILLSTIYIRWFYTYLDDVPEHLRISFAQQKRRTMTWLVASLAVNIALGIVLMLIVDKKLRLLGDICWTLEYAIKLKLEFVVLNRLTKVTEAKRMVLEQGNWVASLPVISPCLSMNNSNSCTAAGHAVNAKSATITTKALEEKELLSSGATDQLERLYLGRYIPES
jgi:hypothetical protein